MPQAMTIDIVKELIKSYSAGHRRFVRESKAAERYYENKNDILFGIGKNRDNDPLRNADNRIPRNFHGLLVNQKAAYMFSAPPLFDVGNEKANRQIADLLGDKYAKVCKDLCIKASNCKVAWLHYWKDDDGQWKYGVIDPKQIIPVYSADLDRQLDAVLRNYKTRDVIDGKAIYVWEYWTAEKCYVYKKKSSSISETGLESYNVYELTGSPDESAEQTNVFEHGFGEVPFIPFYNNNIPTDDLTNIKLLSDAYDKVFSGFLNDLEDTQEIIFILTNYGGQDLKSFIAELKEYKAIKVETDGSGGSGGVEALTISIPIEAREKFLEITRKAIFEQGMGVDPDPQKFGNTSGEALKYLYSLLELKAGLMETEFKLGFGRLVRAICRHLGFECKQITQTWTRTAIRSESELADIATKSVGVISHKTILKNHPWVENAEEEEKQLKREEEEDAQKADLYQQAFGQEGKKEGKGGEGDDDDTGV